MLIFSCFINMLLKLTVHPSATHRQTSGIYPSLASSTARIDTRDHGALRSRNAA